MIEIKNLNKKFQDNNVLKNLNIKIKKGESAVVIGQSGTGKSVMLKCLLGLINPDKGSIRINNKEIYDKNLKYINKNNTKIGMLFQGGALFDSLPIWKNVSFTALQEKVGVSNQEPTGKHAISNLKKKRQEQPSIDDLLEEIIAGNTAALSRGITLIESQNSAHKDKANKLIQNCLEHRKPSIRIGITGVPGVGKSTFIEALGTYLTGLDKKVAVLAVDPTSRLSKGSILGDKTRMETLVKNPNAFIRPSAAGEALGGVARHTRETITLCETAGYDVILIETVGVGQSETLVHSMVDFFLLLKLS